MSTGAIVVIVIAGVVVLALAAFLVRLELRRRQLRDRFGPEYDRVREDSAGRRAATRQLTERERRHAELGIQPISPMSRDRYTKHWSLIQATFVDQPGKAVDEADRLVVTIMEERGYPYADFDERVSMLSVEHGAVLHHYRTAHDIRGRHAISQLSTEDLRAAMVHYRTLIEDLLDAKPESIRPKAPSVFMAPSVTIPSTPEPEPTVLPAANGTAAREAEEPIALREDREAQEIEPSPTPEPHPVADTSQRPEAEKQLHPEAHRA